MVMLSWVWLFLALVLIAAIFAFGGVMAAVAGVAKVVFFVFLVLLVISLMVGRRTVV
jgi:uncharacterized membrane protein YtjA (UPF0391 family)